MATKKHKGPAIEVPTDPLQVDNLILQLGTLDRQLAALKLSHEERLAPLHAEFARQALTIQSQINERFTKIHGYCSAHRDELLPDKDLKTATFGSGTVAWKIRPPSVEFKKGMKVEDVVSAIKRHAESVKGLSIVPHLFQETMGLIRTKEEVNKEAVLEKPELIAGMDAIYIRKDMEDFVITPTEVKLPTVFDKE